MSKYPFALKLRIINEFISEDQSYEKLALKFGIEDVTLIQQWVHEYKEKELLGLFLAEKESRN